MAKKIIKFQTLLALCFFFSLVMFYSAPAARAAAPKQIVVGSSISKTGALAAFGVYQQWGYTAAVKDINKTGGVYLSKYGKKLPVKLILYDDESRPANVSQNTERLVLKDGVNALLSPSSPPLVIPAAMIADREGVPMSAALCPIRAFLAAKKKWTWVWDMFFDELDMSRQQMLTMNMEKSNRKIALFTDNEQDGIIQGKLWTKYAPEYKYKIVYHASFPVGTTDYGDLIRRAQAGNAQIIICQMITPDAISLWRQMRSLGYKPKAAFFEKGGEPMEWWKALGMAAQGTMVAGYWAPSLGYPGAKALRERFEKETGQTYSQHIADTYVAPQIVFDAMKRAGSLNPKAVNAQMAKTNKTYLIGHVKYSIGGHAAPLKAFMLQWQNGNTQIVYPPKWATAKMIYPLP